jgi:hypothetical protein
MPRGSNSCEQSLAAIATYTTVVLAPHAVDDGGGASDTRRDFDRLAGAIHLAGATLHAVFAMGDEGLAFDEGEYGVGADLLATAAATAERRSEDERMTI